MVSKAIGFGRSKSSYLSRSPFPYFNHVLRSFSGNEDSEQTSNDPMGEEEDIDVELPPPDVQSFLLHLYFAYVHPFFPAIHKQDFLHNYSAMCVCRDCTSVLLMRMASVIKRAQCTTATPDTTTLQDAATLYVRDCCQILGQASRPSSARRSLCGGWAKLRSGRPSPSRLAL